MEDPIGVAITSVFKCATDADAEPSGGTDDIADNPTIALAPHNG